MEELDSFILKIKDCKTHQELDKLLINNVLLWYKNYFLIIKIIRKQRIKIFYETNTI